MDTSGTYGSTHLLLSINCYFSLLVLISTSQIKTHFHFLCVFFSLLDRGLVSHCISILKVNYAPTSLYSSILL